jgi:Ca2+-binding RTX toxin-like protein
VSNVGDVVQESAGNGTDTVYASADFALGAGQEVEYLRADAGKTNLHLAGNELANSLYSGAGDDTLAGGGGNDLYHVNNGLDQVQEAAGGGTDTVYASVDYALAGGEEIEILRADAGTTGLQLAGNEMANSLYGGAGYDTLAGGGGDDRYYVNDGHDLVREAIGGGTDTVYASASYTLAAGQEIEDLRALDALSALRFTGNEFANTLVGSDQGDALNGGGGADLLIGGLGNDNYYVDGTDRVDEAAGGGSDTVRASADFTLGAGQEIEYLRAEVDTGLRLTGNEFANRIDGAGGSDTLTGGEGDDCLVDKGNVGGTDSNTFDGGAGADREYGGAGIDTFVYRSASDSGPGTARDVLYGFTDTQDFIDLHAMDADASLAGTQSFIFDGQGAASMAVAPGHLKVYEFSTNTFLIGNTGTGATGDFMICLSGFHTLSAGGNLVL